MTGGSYCAERVSCRTASSGTVFTVGSKSINTLIEAIRTSDPELNVYIQDPGFRRILAATFLWAVQTKHRAEPALVRHLLSFKPDTSVMTDKGETLLMLSVNNLLTLESLLALPPDRGPDLNAVDDIEGNTAFFWAVQLGLKSAALMLHDAGADPFIRNAKGELATMHTNDTALLLILAPSKSMKAYGQHFLDSLAEAMQQPDANQNAAFCLSLCAKTLERLQEKAGPIGQLEAFGEVLFSYSNVAASKGRDADSSIAKNKAAKMGHKQSAHIQENFGTELKRSEAPVTLFRSRSI